MAVIPVVLSGGSGTRLWPLSRKSLPKQFLRLFGSSSLFEQTLTRCDHDLFDRKPVVVGAQAHERLIDAALASSGWSADVLLEPVSRNTCAAIAAACLQAHTRDNDATVLVMPADHVIDKKEEFFKAVAQALPAAQGSSIVTFGIKPTGANSNYGYLEPGVPLNSSPCFRVNRFVEKPDVQAAGSLIRSGALWNSGIFLFRVDVVIRELKSLQFRVLEAVRNALKLGRRKGEVFTLHKTSFASSPDISFDHAIMEETEKAACLPVSLGWSDVGNWDGLLEPVSTDDCENKGVGHFALRESAGNFVYSEDQLTALVGVENLIVVSTKDAVLVANREKAGEIRSMYDALERSSGTVKEQNVEHRPWGNFQRLDLGERFQVKRLTVKPGGVLSMQVHCRRSEHWIVVSGNAEVTVGGQTFELGPNSRKYVPKGSVHRLANKGTEPLVVIEVQTGDYFGEDDITRLEDIYDRR